MADSQTVLFEDQERRRRRFELHIVADALRIDLDTALLNYSATSFSRVSDGLVLERFQDSRYSALTFKPGETVLVEAVRPQDDNLRLLEELDKRFAHYGQSLADEVVKRILPELGSERLSHLMRVQYADPAAAQPMQQDSPAAATPVDVHGQPTDGLQPDHGLAAINTSLAMTPTPGSPQGPISEYNASGKKRRFCGACQNHNVRTPVTFQHQQVCPWRACACALCVKKRQISQAQAHKRHAAKAQATQQHQQPQQQEQLVGHMHQPPPQLQLQPDVQQQQPQQEASGSLGVENGGTQQQQQPLPVPMPMGVAT